MSENGSPRSPNSTSPSAGAQFFRQTSTCSLEDVVLVEIENDTEIAVKPERPRPWIVRKIEQKYQSTIGKVPPKYKWLFLFVWVGWKVVAVYLIYFVFKKEPSHAPTNVWVPSILPNVGSPSNDHHAQVRVLYIVTSTVSHGIGKEKVENSLNSSSLSSVLPLLQHNLATIVDDGYYVDLVWMYQDDDPASTSGSSDFHRRVLNALPTGVGLSFWPQPSPFSLNSETSQLGDPSGLDMEEKQKQLINQAWWLIRDKFPLYHMFLVWPDSAKVLGGHVTYFWETSQRLLELSMSEKTTSNSYSHLVPAFVPAFFTTRHDAESANATTDGSDLSTEESLRLLQISDDEPAWDDFETTMSIDNLEGGPLVSMSPLSDQMNGTVETLHTVTVPSASLPIYNGFMITRSQLAQHGLLECLFPSNELPIARPLDEPKKKRDLCDPRGMGEKSNSILLVENLPRHMVQFIGLEAAKTQQSVRNHKDQQTRVSDWLENAAQSVAIS